MKKLTKILAVGTISMLGLYSCSDNFDELNVDKKHSTELPSKNLLASSLLHVSSSMYTPGVNNNNFRFFVQHTTETSYTDESNYDLNKRNQPRNTFNALYTKGLNSIRLAKEALKKEANPEANKIIEANKLATLEIQELFLWEALVDTYGDLPYSEALVPGISSPKYDDALTIYKDLILRLDKAINSIDVSVEGYGKEDLIYSGNMGKWKKFANSIKLRLGMNLADVDASLSKKIVEETFTSGLISNDSESYSLVYDGATYSSPVYNAFVASGRSDFIPAKGLVDLMVANSDPRLDVWFTKAKETDATVTPPVISYSYKGGIIGSKNSFGKYSHYKEILTDADAPVKLLSFTEVAFLLTEAAARGYNVGGTPEELYEDAVKASMAEYGVDVAKITTYLVANPYNAVKWKKTIAEQAWVALFDRAFATWNFSRRLDLDTESNVLVAPTKNELTTKVPFRMPYSDKEYQLNGPNVKSAALSIGGDKAETKLFWDVN